MSTRKCDMATKRVFTETVLMAGLMLVPLLFGPVVSFAQTPALRVRFLGPDDPAQRGIFSMGLGRDRNGATMIGVASNSAVVVLRNGTWSYQLPEYRGFFISPTRVAGFAFLPWEDSVLFIAADVYDSRNNEATTVGARYDHGNVAEQVAGEAWPVVDQSPAFLFLEGTRPCVLAKAYGLFASSDSGRRWELRNAEYSHRIDAADLVLSREVPAHLLRVGFVSGPLGYGIEASSDTGRTWTRRSTFTSTMWGIGFREWRLYPAGDVLYMRSGVFDSHGPAGTALRVSGDGGRIWSECGLFPGVAGIAVDTANQYNVYGVYRDTVCWSLDGGLQWNCAALGIPGARFTMLAKDPNADILYAAGNGIGVYAIEGLPTGIGTIPASPSTTVLGSPYPNPAREDIFIPLTVEKGSTVLVTIHDALGRRVATLHDGPLGAGSHTLRWGVSGLAKGMYAVRVSCAGRVSTRQFAIE